MKNQIFRFFAIALVSVSCNYASAEWGANAGYHNPPGSNIGVNFMYQWTNWAFEAGVGGVDTSSSSTTNSSSSTSTLSVGGDVNLKYLFGGKGVRPYLGAGVLLGTSASAGGSTGVSAGSGTSFFTGGIMAGSRTYFYLGGNLYSSRIELSLGLGFNF